MSINAVPPVRAARGTVPTPLPTRHPPRPPRPRGPDPTPLPTGPPRPPRGPHPGQKPMRPSCFGSVCQFFATLIRRSR
ncbi:hypothetical protein CXF43_03820 [Corynebacterium bovis]|uniref:Uncharacterized protein n=1 Tax=Corynebacterium bovis TaxID=36808 RepID=A0A426Q3V7_9CORY|nr:hypothetical protein CXF31_02450 [Corynebacterium bovis]RRQ00279.1 hypothetical protein CXF41_07355 [Corynebacterium bovis]RRQ03369.1 hypothetical protein CXF42_07335 [Corynebacterium bovis]RRQ07667.1 hypothetical protein CXF43_03820 [Corynebacterium bovis]RRQ09748.1 hypothetical protein CXF44_07265 [Corynebacterium bovis]